MAAEKTREIKISIPEELFSLLLPLETQRHLRGARKEMLLALRSLIDARLEMIEKKEGAKGEVKRKVKIE